ncbi:hypothetical protein BHM03_00016088 [Ensete ventricosum]|nr:hypothetical protein BHM03_00016088 [Ensete ventricosum]
MPIGTTSNGQPAGAIIARWHTRLHHDTHKGGQLQGTRKGMPPAASPTASRGGGIGHRVGRPLAGWLPAGKGSHRLRRGSNGDDGADGAREVTAGPTMPWREITMHDDATIRRNR